jgi:hypothetical protein
MGGPRTGNGLYSKSDTTTVGTGKQFHQTPLVRLVPAGGNELKTFQGLTLRSLKALRIMPWLDLRSPVAQNSGNPVAGGRSKDLCIFNLAERDGTIPVGAKGRDHRSLGQDHRSR